MNKPFYLDFSILKRSKIVTYQFWFDYVKPKHGGKARLCYILRDSFIVYIKTKYIYTDIAKQETRSDNSNYELDRLPKGKKSYQINEI